VIEAKIIGGGEFLSSGDLGANTVVAVDGSCDPGFKALFAVPGVREASSTPYAADNQIDWVLQPYTAYVGGGGQTVWITDDTPLLGIRNGAPMPLESSIGTLSTTAAISGLTESWTTATTDTCNGWTDGTDNSDAAYGDQTSTTDFIAGAGTKGCGDWSQFINGIPIGLTFVYCVEQ
jgi:hypothetical protein